MSISKSAFSLSKDEYEGTGKRLFIGLVIGTAILLCVLLLLIWLVPTIGFAAIHPWLPFIAGIVFGGAILGILWLSVGLVLHAYTGIFEVACILEFLIYFIWYCDYKIKVSWY